MMMNRFLWPGIHNPVGAALPVARRLPDHALHAALFGAAHRSDFSSALPARLAFVSDIYSFKLPHALGINPSSLPKRHLSLLFHKAKQKHNSALRRWSLSHQRKLIQAKYVAFDARRSHCFFRRGSLQR
jgi:hypothetical protein